jgi:class 3 adenylate cyclase/tetratricopeptide (TPR) repeat protein
MDVEGWLRKLGLEQYEAAFRENNIDDTVLPRLTAEDLKDLGVGSVGHRRKLIDAIASLQAEASAQAPSPSDAFPPIDKSIRDAAERRQVTVMFSDLVGSTALSARLDPEDLREVTSAYQKCVAETVCRFGGFVAKYMGDGVLVYFGYPQAHEDDAERAVRAGLELVAAIGDLKTHAALQTRVGIATGLVVVGDLIGSGASQEQAIIGDTPNLAARLQGIAEPNTVVIAEATRGLLGNLFELRDLGPKDLKGIAGPVRAFAALRVSSVEGRFEAMHPSGMTALVGREEELDLLVRRWSKAKNGEGQVVLLSGEAGIGKSRLTAALLERLALEPHIRLRYFCSPQRVDSALFPIMSQMERAAGLAQDDTVQTKLDKLDALLAQSSTPPEDSALFAEMLSLPNDGRYPSLELAPQQRRQRLFDALTAQVATLARQTPVLMILEDAHWIDPTSLEAFGRAVMDRTSVLNVFMIVTYRPEFTPSWIGQPHVTTVTLNRLGQSEIAAMIDAVVGNKPLLASTKQEIMERTDGIPLFVEEMTKAVVEAGARDSDVVDTLLSMTSVPATLHASLMARLDRLGPFTKEVAQIGAAIGREFSYEMIAAVTRQTDAALRGALNSLTEAGLVFCRGVPPQATFLFKHALVRDAAYGSMLRSQRRRLHALIVAALEKLDAETAVLAQHCADAGLQEKAVGYWLGAGQEALRRSANVEAVAVLTKGLSLLGTMPEDAWRQRQELELQIALGQAFQFTRGPAAQETGKAYARAVQLGERLNQGDRLPPIIFGAWVHYLMRGELERSRENALTMERLAEEGHDPRLKVMGFRLLGQSEFLLGELAAARVHLERGIADFDAADRPFYSAITTQDGRVLMLAFLSHVLAPLGYLDQSQARADDAVEEGRRLGHNYTLGAALAFSLIQSVISCRAAASLAEVLRQSEEIEAFANEHEMLNILHTALLCRSWFLAELGRTEEALELFARAEELGRTIGVLSYHPFRSVGAAEMYGRTGQVEIAFSRLSDAERFIETSGERWYEAEVHRLRGQLLRATGDDANAEVSFRRAVRMSKDQSAKFFELRASAGLACLWRDRGKRKEAGDLLAPIYSWFTEGFDTPVLKEAKALLDELG